MPSVSLKGVEGLYEDSCSGSFYEWINIDKPEDANVFRQQQICKAPISYNDAEALTLVEANYDPLDEFNSTWKLTHFSSGPPAKRLPHRPYKLFQLESDDNLLVVKCKVRPVVLIRKVSTDWRIPDNAANLFNAWLCLPLFSYKQRHTQKYVLNDQSLKRPEHFYFPPGTPGIDNESVGKLLELQFIAEKNLMPAKAFCTSQKPEMQRPYQLSNRAFQSVVGHITTFFPGITLAGDSKEWYDFFLELVQEEIAKIVI